VDAPEAFPGLRIETLDGIARATDDLRGATLAQHVGRDMRDAGRTAPAGPSALAGLGIQCDEQRPVPGNLPAETLVVADLRIDPGLADLVAAVVGHDEHAIIEQRRGAQPMPAVK